MDARRSGCIFSHRLSAGELIELLETTAALERRVAGATKADHRPLVHHSLSHTADHVGHARSADGQRNTRAPSQVANDAGGIRCRRLHSETKVVHVLTLES